jgi:hypothetical protein
MLGWIKNSMNLNLRVGLRIVNSSEDPHPMWIETPKPMPTFGTTAFRNIRVIVNARRDWIESSPFGWVVAGFAHELAHVVLFSIGHPLQLEEKAVDLTAMLLGFQKFITSADRIQRDRRQRLGYLTSFEAEFAYKQLSQGTPHRSSPAV